MGQTPAGFLCLRLGLLRVDFFFFMFLLLCDLLLLFRLRISLSYPQLVQILEPFQKEREARLVQLAHPWCRLGLVCRPRPWCAPNRHGGHPLVCWGKATLAKDVLLLIKNVLVVIVVVILFIMGVLLSMILRILLVTDLDGTARLRCLSRRSLFTASLVPLNAVLLGWAKARIVERQGGEGGATGKLRVKGRALVYRAAWANWAGALTVAPGRVDA